MRTQHRWESSSDTSKAAADLASRFLTPKSVGAAAVAGSVVWVAKNSVLMTDAGVTYVVQNNLTGVMDVYSEPGLHRRVPFFSSVTAYKQVVTQSFEGKDEVTARFADTYVGHIPVTFRFKLPTHPEEVLKIHREFRSEPISYRRS